MKPDHSANGKFSSHIDPKKLGRVKQISDDKKIPLTQLWEAAAEYIIDKYSDPVPPPPGWPKKIFDATLGKIGFTVGHKND